MAAQIEALKGHLKADKHLEKALNDDKKTRNKKNRGDKNRQKEDEAWKKVPPNPKDGDKKSKKVGKHTYHWCVHHMAWCMHLPTECRLGLQRVQQTPTVANSTSIAAAAAAIANPQFQALLATIGAFQGEDE